MKFTVITIAYNEERNIVETMQSVLRQNYKDLEYLIIDGASSDCTVEIAKRLSDESGRDVKIYSEFDFGIYNAMNRGIARASGEYVIFMNAGDTFYSDTVLEEMVKKIKLHGSAIYYGYAYLMRNGKCQRVKNNSKETRMLYDALLKGWMPIHQSIAAPIGTLKRHYFNEEYKIRADYDWILKCYKEGVRFVDLGFPVCRYDCSGISSKAAFMRQMRQETKIIRRDTYPILARIYEMYGL